MLGTKLDHPARALGGPSWCRSEELFSQPGDPIQCDCDRRAPRVVRRCIKQSPSTVAGRNIVRAVDVHPATLKLVSAKATPCPGGQDGFRLSITYQVMGDDGQPLRQAGLTPLETASAVFTPGAPPVT